MPYEVKAPTSTIRISRPIPLDPVFQASNDVAAVEQARTRMEAAERDYLAAKRVLAAAEARAAKSAYALAESKR